MGDDDVLVPVGDGIRLRVRRRAGAGRRAFLLVHGLSSNALLWDGVADALAEAGHPSYAVDLRGHGESDTPPTGYDTATAVADLAAVVTALDIAPVIAVGQSWGGNVVVRLAAEHPALVAALALVDGGWIDLRARFDTWEECLSALRPPDLAGRHVDEVRQQLRAGHPGWSEPAVDATLASLRVGADGAVSRRLPLEHHLAVLRDMYDDPPQRFYPALAMPVLLLPAVPAGGPEAAEVRVRVATAAAEMDRPIILEYEGADHDLHAHYPARVAADLIALAREVS